MNFGQGSRTGYLESFNFSSLTDVVMQLLIFFLLTFSFANTQGMNITLPKAQVGQPPHRKSISLSIGRDRKVYLNSQEVSREKLSGLIATLLNSDRDQQVVVRADKNLVLQEVIEVFDIAKGAGATRLFIATESADEKK